MLPDGLGADVDTSTWTTPPLFEWLIASAELDTEQAHRIFNCGVGMVLIVKPADVAAVQAAIDEPTWVMGEVTVHEDGDRVQLV